MELREITKDLFLFVATFRERIERGQNPQVNQIRNEVRGIFGDMDYKAKGDPAVYARYEKLRYGLVALVDEVVLNADWKEAASWPVLELEFYNTNIAGNHVYELVKSLTPADKDLIEGYFFILALGFRGQYTFEEPKWAEHLQQLYRQLPRKLDETETRLTPEAYRVIPRKSQKLDPLFSLVRSLLIFFICAATVIVFYQVAWGSVVREARESSRQVIQYIQDQDLRTSLQGDKQ